MEETARQTVDRVLAELLRAPEPLQETDVQGALTRLQAARGDAGYLLLHRVLVLETALQQLRQRTGQAGARPPGSAAIRAPARAGFIRDAAAVALGVVAGQAVWDGIGGATDESLGGLAEPGGLDSLLD